MLKGAFVGFGNVARLGHLPAWLSRDDVEIVAAADVRPEGRTALAAALPAARWYESPQAMLAEEELDFVDVCTPPAFHAAEIRRALEREVHVLCEKPLVLREDDLEELAALARRNNRALATVHNWRHAPALRRVSELAAAGELGSILRCRWETLRDQPAGAAGFPEGGNWRVDPAIAGGGILIDHGWHALYAIQSWISGEPERIRATLESRRHREWAIEDTAEVRLDFPQAAAEIFLTWAAGDRANRLWLEGSAATLVLDGARLEIRQPDGTVRSNETIGRLSEGSHHPDWFGATAAEFLSEIREPSRRGRSLGEARKCLRWIATAREASRRGAAVEAAAGSAASGAPL
ncbi:MAG TPA: Gfo/Idh/MocA family oxidoreductase [Thermoanaerobaculia bacterium]|nr:Gfo/Idh/MocA family oxidoreductase [Thermoanaerobaculia bacterium]